MSQKEARDVCLLVHTYKNMSRRFQDFFKDLCNPAFVSCSFLGVSPNVIAGGKSGQRKVQTRNSLNLDYCGAIFYVAHLFPSTPTPIYKGMKLIIIRPHPGVSRRPGVLPRMMKIQWQHLFLNPTNGQQTSFPFLVVPSGTKYGTLCV